MICNFFPEPSYFFFTDLPGLLYYSHIPTTILALLFGLFVYFSNRFSLLNKLLLLISLSFSLWTFSSLISWTNIHSDFILFIWPLFSVTSSFISIFSIYFIYVFLEKKDASPVVKSVFLALLLPVLIFAPSNLNLTGFDITNCDGFGFEGFLFKLYFTSIGVLAMLWIMVLLVRKYIISPVELRKQILLVGLGVELFLFIFFTLTFLAAYLTGLGFLEDSSLEFYGLFGMDIFMVFIAVLIVRFKTFNIKLLGAQALVVALWFLVGSLLFVAQSTTTRTVAGVTLVFTSIAGYYLVRSVKKEVKQREELEILTDQLAKANDRLKILDKMKSEFVSIASHQLRSPLTSIRGYASMLAEGSYGKIPEKAQEALNNIVDSSKFMAMSIEDYLNVSRIEAGNMKYEMSDFNLKDIAEKVVDEMRPTAMKKGLVMVFRSDCSGSATINADIGKTRQVIMNLVDNSMKYTPKGTITVVAHDDVKKKKMYITIQDTGIGMSKETQEEVFDKFVRAKNANSVNVTGTGLGLFVAKKMVDEMKGKVWAESEGEGKGSTFHIEFPMIAGSSTAR
jgi:signal transduction histidine kinase